MCNILFSFSVRLGSVHEKGILILSYYTLLFREKNGMI